MDSLWNHPVISLVGIGVVSLATFLYLNQRRMIYPSDIPAGSRHQVDLPIEHGLTEYDVVWIKNTKEKQPSTTTTLHAYFIRPNDLQQRKRQPTILYCHANAGNMGHRLPIVKRILEECRGGCNVLLFSYRGYGKSSGTTPHEAGMKSDAETAVEWLLARDDLDLKKLVLFGQSIGGAVAIHLAQRYPDRFRGLIVENTFLSLDKLVPHVMPIARFFIPFLLTEHWPSEESIRKCDPHLPFLFLSSTRDELVPHREHQLALFNQAPMISKWFRVIKGATHNDPVIFREYWEYFREFLDYLERSHFSPTQL